MLKKIACITIITMMLSSATAFAQDEVVHRILKDSLYGAAIGAAGGLAVLLLTKHPGDHLDYIPIGAGIGILGGLTFGLATTSGRIAIAEVEDGKVTLNVPDIRTKIIRDKVQKTREVVSTVDLLRYKF